jgi:hypothetical protein
MSLESKFDDPIRMSHRQNQAVPARLACTNPSSLSATEEISLVVIVSSHIRLEGADG